MKKILSLVLAAVLCCLALASCGSDANDKVIKIAASSTPHAEILEQVKPILEKDGYTVEIQVMDDYVIQAGEGFTVFCGGALQKGATFTIPAAIEAPAAE